MKTDIYEAAKIKRILVLESVLFFMLAFSFPQVSVIGETELVVAQGDTFAEDTKPKHVREWRICVTIDLGKDRGQNFGSLFEALDDSGKAVAGAGFLGAYNTYYREDRHVLHAFVNPRRESERVETSSFPRPSSSVLHYLFQDKGRLFATNRASPEDTYLWEPKEKSWKYKMPPQPPCMHVGSRQVEFCHNTVAVDGREVFRFPREKGAAGLFYYANETLFFHVSQTDSPNFQTYLYACPWDIAQNSEPDMTKCNVLPLKNPREFPYSYGQLENAVYIGTNNGAVIKFQNGSWTTLREANPNVSFQVYAMINYHDRLLMGQYPTGELFEVVNDKLVHLAGWPPRPINVSGTAREAQTMTIYRGDLFVGVWPWGEVWRLCDRTKTWDFVGRLFTHPEPTSDITAPYELEMTQLGEKVNNLWGQRVTSLIPFQDMLIASTSNKGGTPYRQEYTFLNNNIHEEYGALHGLYLPGHICAPIDWNDETMTFEISIGNKELIITQNGDLLGKTALPPPYIQDFNIHEIRWGTGVFGRLSGTLVDKSLKTLPQ